MIFFFNKGRFDTKKLNQIEAEVNRLAAIINAPGSLLPTYGYSKDLRFCHVEAERNGRLSWVAVERGEELKRHNTSQLDELLYWIFSDITFSMALAFELKHRIENQDFRRIMFAKQRELLGTINPKWKALASSRHRDILKDHPFDDLASLRASYFGTLRNQGYPEPEI